MRWRQVRWIEWVAPLREANNVVNGCGESVTVKDGVIDWQSAERAW